MSLEHKKRGIKRKREDVQVDLHQKIAGKLHHGLQEARRAAKTAKTFETQRLVKKLKATKPSPDAAEVAALESQLKELKEADHERIGAMAFISKLKKDKVLHRHSDFQTAFEAEISRTSTPTTSGLSPQLESRLLSSKVLSAEINTVISSLRAIIAPPADPAGAEDGKNDVGEGEDESGELAERPSKAAKLSSTLTSVPPKLKSSTLHTAAESSSSEEEASEEEGLNAELEEPVADDGWESGTVDEENDRMVDDDDGSESDSSASPLAPSASAKSKPSESLFLPSLAVGYTRGDSDSDFSDSEAKVADSVRKNRRGQRARRAIWEKKYGKGAKHLINGAADDAQQGRDGSRQRPNERQGPRQRDNGRAPQPGRPPQTNAGRPPQRDVVPRHQQPVQPYHPVPHFNGPPPPFRSTQKSTEEKPLHPSWEAKKRLKEQQSAGIRPPTGTRITFDD
ncbi:Bud-site selection protein [Peniophora sp. CONT]|nr:Bud-site selection protein [Peniophora sp. CONT]